MAYIPSYIISLSTLIIITVSLVVGILVSMNNGHGPYGTPGSWSSPENQRDNWSIIWSCLVTIFICVWTIFHPDIEVRRARSVFASSRLQWFAVGLFAPEFIAIIAMTQFLRIWAIRRQVTLQSSSRKSELQHWSWTQYFYADMGGFAVDYFRSTAEDDGHSCVHQLSLRSVVQMCDNGHASLFRLSTEEIKDRSKADWLAKAITLCQVLWFIAQVIGRAAAKLPMTTMELVTVAYVATSAFTIVFWWTKPLDIKMPTVLHLRFEDLDPALKASVSEVETASLSGSAEMPLIERIESNKPSSLKQSFEQHIANISVPVAVNSRIGPYIHFLIVTLLSVVFGLIHLIAFFNNFYFVHGYEKALWFFSSFGTTILPPCVYMLYYAPMQHHKPSRVSEILRYAVLVLTGTLYILSRLYLIVEPFVGLREVEVGVYDQLRWAQYWPHVH